MEAGNGKLSALQITCYVQSSPIPRLRVLQKKLCQTSLKHASTAAIESPITIVDGVLQERSIWWFMNNSDQFFLNKHFMGVHDTERLKPGLSNFEVDIIDQLYNKLENIDRSF